MRNLILAFLLLVAPLARAQFAPQAGVAGNTAISVGSGEFVAWATGCTVYRGYMNIANKSLGYASAGDSSQATGPANTDIVSLGDSGVAVLTFAHHIYDGSGADFAVFENGFADPSDPSMAFLELAFVEVSSDGVRFVRFPATSNTAVASQIPMAGVYTDASLINNLAGKYIAGYGTPFDLQELADSPGLDINNITHVRVIDVIGAINGPVSVDHSGHVINDPYPTQLPTGGFDLDAVGAIHMYNAGVEELGNRAQVAIFPNPVASHLTLSTSGDVQAVLSSVTGEVLQHLSLSKGDNRIDVSSYPAGIYLLTLQDASGKWSEKLIKR
jgi:hypothetical protein